MLTTDDRREIANTIIQQLGGGRFKAMTGATNFVFGADENPDVSFRLPIGKWNHVKIELTPMDLYTVTFSKIGRSAGIQAVLAVDVHEEIYAEDLQDVVTRATGLALSL